MLQVIVAIRMNLKLHAFHCQLLISFHFCANQTIVYYCNGFYHLTIHKKNNEIVIFETLKRDKSPEIIFFSPEKQFLLDV